MSATRGRPGPLAALLALHLILGLILVAGYRHQVNPDAIAYLSVARKYLGGHFGAAVTGFWSPLYSWLLAPLLALRIPPLLATKLLDLAAGALAIAAAWRLTIQLGLDLRVRLAVGFTVMVTVLYFGLTVATPDLLSAALVLLYLGSVADPDGADRRKPVIAGVLGGLAYLCKAYALGFVLIHLAVLTAARLVRGTAPRELVLRRSALTLAAFVLVAAPWVLVVSAKYGRFMLGDAGRLSWGYDGPGRPGYPMQRDGFIPPPDGDAVSAWDDPGRMSLPDWSPLRSDAEREHFVGMVRANASSIAAIVQGFSVLALAILAVGLLVVASRDDPVAWTVLSGLILYPTGYLVFHLRDRFLVVMCILLLVLGAFAVVALGRALATGAQGRAVALAAVCLSFLPAPISGLRAAWGDGRQWTEMARELESVPAGARVASNGRWRQTLYVAFHRGWRYYGEPRPGTTPEGLEGDLRRHGIEYFLVWGDASGLPFVAGWPLVARGSGLKAYRVEP